MDSERIHQLCELIQSNADNDKKVSALQALQADLADAALEADAVIHALKASLRSSNQAVSSASLALLQALAPSLDAGPLARHLVTSLTAVTLDKLGDQKERARLLARACLVSIGASAYKASGAHLSSSTTKETALGVYERILREQGLGAKMARIREQCLLLLPELRARCDKYPIRPLMPVLVDLLADADASVREGAKSTLIALFLGATPAAKAELKKELETKGARKQTVEAILSELLAPAPQSSSEPAAQHIKSSVQGNEDIKPVYVASRSDLERTFVAFLPFFDGKETEHNWSQREQSMIKMRGMIKAQAHAQFGASPFVYCVKTAQEGILKALASLRTTLSMHAISLIAELAAALNDDFAPLVEGLLTPLMRMAGFTKKLVANATQEAAATIMRCVAYKHLFLQLVWQGMQEKNVQTRVFASEHLSALLAQPKKHAVEAHGGLETLQNALRRGLADQNPGVRANTREAFWRFYKVWPEAKAMLDKFDATVKKQVMATAPAEMDGAVEAPKAKPSGIPARRPGGPSAALLTAKRAAAMEKERLRAQEVAAEHEARLASRQETPKRAVSAAQVPLPNSPGDETAQLPAFGDVSVDLMTFSSSPTKGMADESLAFETPVPRRTHPASMQRRDESTPQPRRAASPPPLPQPRRAASPETTPRRPIEPVQPSTPPSSQWIDTKSARLENPLSSPSKPDLNSLSSGSADLRTFRRLAKISSGRISLADFHSLWNAVTSFLADAPAGDMRTAALVLLHRLVASQYPHLVESGLEPELLAIALSGKDRASQGVLSTWCAQVDPVLGFGALSAHPLSKASLHALALVTSKLPSEVVADQLPRLADKLTAALSDEDVEVRQGSVAVLVAAQRQCGTPAVFASLGPLDVQKQDLLMYYFSKG